MTVFSIILPYALIGLITAIYTIVSDSKEGKGISLYTIVTEYLPLIVLFWPVVWFFIFKDKILIPLKAYLRSITFGGKKEKNKIPQ